MWYLIIYESKSIFAQPTPLNELSENFLIAVIKKSETAGIDEKIKNITQDDLNQLSTDVQKRAFWLNIYNAYIQILLNESPELYNDRGNFFSEYGVEMDGQLITFDKIEHGIIRGSTLKLSLGYIRDPFPGKFEKKNRIKSENPRIHFALNCGAESCPPVAIYKPESLDEQLDKAASEYLKKDSRYIPNENKIFVTSLMNWFRGDFGNDKGVLDMLHQYEIIPEEECPSIDYNDYDWTLKLGNFTE
jgi:hypothetical protein